MDRERLFEFCFGVPPSVFPEGVVITPFPRELFKSRCETGSAFKGRLYSGFLAAKGKERVAVVSSGLGDRLAGDAVLLFVSARVKKIVFAGTCGGLNDCAVGDLVVAESAFNGEGFSRYHEKDFDIGKVLDAGASVPADPACTDELSGFLKENASAVTGVKRGSIFTIGSLVAEDRANILGIQGRGFKGVEMELSAVFRAAEVAGIRAAGLVAVSDIPLSGTLGDDLGLLEKRALGRAMKSLAALSVGFAAC